MQDELVWTGLHEDFLLNDLLNDLGLGDYAVLLGLLGPLLLAFCEILGGVYVGNLGGGIGDVACNVPLMGFGHLDLHHLSDEGGGRLPS